MDKPCTPLPEHMVAYIRQHLNDRPRTAVAEHLGISMSTLYRYGLQTIPGWYKWECSETQQYKMLGNGWTVEVIKHIFSFLPDRFKE